MLIGKIASMFGIYLHIPFCLRRCKYCDFITYAGKEELMPSYKSALIRELRHQARKIHGLPARADTVFFGGGTPSLMRAEWIREILDCARGEFRLASGAEISLEANPGTLAPGDFSSLLEAGVNRISIGVQSFDEGELALLGRIHGPDQAVEAVREARREGFRNISIDLMFSLPGQSLARWKENLYEALSLQPDHLSLYSLILEPGTRLFEEVRQGVLQPAEDELAAEMYELAQDELDKAGFTHYEISNWAREEAFEARHNKIYWKNQPYLGLGAGAHSYLSGIRTVNEKTAEEYIRKMQAANLGSEAFPAAVEKLSLDLFTIQQETMMLGMRLTKEGVSEREFHDRFGVGIADVFPKEIERIIARKLAEWRDFSDGPHLVLTKGGALLGNQAFQEFV